MELEKEVRFLVDDDCWEKAIENTLPQQEKIPMLDITMGLFGRESLAKTGKVFRVRQKPNKISLEVKNKIKDGWQEESIDVDSVERAVSFLYLAGMKPYLYISRTREVRNFKNLKIFLDDIELLGKFIEIEYQDSVNAEEELNEFISICDIVGEKQPLYGDIINFRYDNDLKFRLKFEAKLNSIIDKVQKEEDHIL